MTPATHMLQQHQAEVLVGMALDVAWHLTAEENTEALFSARECERIAVAAPTEYLAGFWWGRSLVLREIQCLTKREAD